MKSLLIALVSFAALNASAARINSPACDKNMALTAYDKPAAVQIAAVVAILDARYNLQLSRQQGAKLTGIFTKIVKENPAKLADLGKNAYFVCTTELDREDVQIGQRQIRSILAQ